MDFWGIYLVAGAILPALLSAVFGAMKGRGIVGFFLGLFLSWIGFIITLLLSNEAEKERQHNEMLTAVSGSGTVQIIKVRCPHCKALVDETIKFCPECGGSMTS